ncbi:LOW QUALITY PROTEIN: mediator of RNA polymerase II transcription subunit 28-like [Dermacentor silvarum]|uniref:LOW QUALITY PROTEIN: mediator of RNA polymerase II transcription subunit 28-like n=1 Tax=Dermacentor silvarum TaxID=543639 RepID=UPI001899F644|nr:LOW QUALITY PROTEIN: mediator of RNA polymerase II transcription subunit 28-like [Dermacentor silvarum]
MASSNHIVDDFESSFQACLAAVTNPDYFYVRDSEEVKTGVEQTVQRFLDVAKQMESFFLQKRLVLSAQKSEQMVMEDNTELKNELVRKEQLLQKYNEKIHYWQSLLNDTVNASGQQTQPQPQVPPGGGTQQGMPTQSQQSMPMGGVAQGLPGPLAYLERTTSSIGMPDPRR